MPKKFPSQEMDRFNVRMPAGMREEIARIAEKNGRSMNSEIIQILQDHIDSRNGALPAYALKDIDRTMKTFKDFLIKEYAVKISGDTDKK